MPKRQILLLLDSDKKVYLVLFRETMLALPYPKVGKSITFSRFFVTGCWVCNKSPTELFLKYRFPF